MIHVNLRSVGVGMLLGELDPEPLNMLSLVMVGNSETRRVGQWVYTPRGYHTKPELADTGQ